MTDRPDLMEEARQAFEPIRADLALARGIQYDRCVEAIASALKAAIDAAEARGREEAATFARRLSDALLKVRPLGGSENFVRVGDEFYADPELLGREIEKLRADLHDIKSKYFTLRKEQAAIRRGTP